MSFLDLTPIATISDLCERADRLFPENVFGVVHDHPELTITYRTLNHLKDRMRREMAKTEGPIVLYLPNCPAWVICFLAIVSNGQTAVILDGHLEPATVLRQIADSTAPLVITSAEKAEEIGRLWGEHVSSHPLPLFYLISVTELPSFPPLSDQEKSLPRASADSVALIMYTSGSVGLPKGVVLTHRALICSVLNCSGYIYPAYSKCQLALAPFSHITGIQAVLLMGIYGGAQLVFVTSMKPKVFLEAIVKHGVQVVSGPPILMEMICRKLVQKIGELSWIKRFIVKLFRTAVLALGFVSPYGGHLLGRALFRNIHSSLGVLYCGGARLPAEVGRTLFSFGYYLHTAYGLSETSGVTNMNPHIVRYPRSVGKCNPHVEIKIDHPNDQGIGEILVKSEQLLLCYFQNPALTKEHIRSGWFFTGDLGYMNRAGYLFIVGRSKEVIVTPEGEKVYPNDLEEYFMDLHQFERICVFGLTLDEKEYPALVIQLSSEYRSQEVAIREKIAAKNSALPPSMRLKYIFIEYDPLPILPTGKVHVPSLAKKYQERLATLNNGRP